jgi:hypothetical protein
VSDFRATPANWTREGLEEIGFVGWVPFRGLQAARVPTTEGVYVVVRTSTDLPVFLDASPAGWFKGKDPTVLPATLHSEWVSGASVIYLGKATNLRNRLSSYRRHGGGEPVGHAGGRYIWQVAGSEQYLVAWKETPGEDPGGVETRLIAAFTRDYGSRPFANLTD